MLRVGVRGSSVSEKSVDNSGESVKIDSYGMPYKYPGYRLSKAEYGKVVHEIDTWYYRKYDGKTDGWLIMPNASYHFEIHGFNEYNIYEKR